MPKLWKNPKSSNYWFRKRVPERLRAEIKSSEIRFSLRTKDPVIAQALNDAKHAELDERWAKLLSGPVSLDFFAIEALAGEFYANLIARHRREPGLPKQWEMRAFWDRLNLNLTPKKYFAKSLTTTPNMRLQREVRVFLREKGVRLDPVSHHRFLLAAAQASILAAEQIGRIASSDFSPDPNANRYPIENRRRGPEHRFDRLFERFADEVGYPERTRRSWKARVGRFMAFCGREYPADVTKQDILKFTRYLIEQKLDRDATIRNGYFAAIRAFMKWCLANDLGPESDPLQHVKIYPDRTKKKIKQRKSYSDEEAATILAAALLPIAGRRSPTTILACRWIPWICATTGARVTEVAQLRRQDIGLSERTRRFPLRIPVIRFTLEAGPQKTAERVVPVHPDLVALGFLDFVEGTTGERLFVDPERARRRPDVSGLTKSAGKSVASWARSVVGSTVVQPNHAWRHRFNTLSNQAHVHPEFRDVITGHVPATVGAAYGDMHPALLLHHMKQMDSHLDLIREFVPDIGPFLPAKERPPGSDDPDFQGFGVADRQLPVIHDGGTQIIGDDANSIGS
ncbi:DUF6538 domain-containing protein [Methylobacterium oxalidis]|uniref:DUF6538 domain-containing protein n=1 Tax=Methylobacterium oxalidis TaxID=944322 RepID=UPI00331612C1